MAITRAGRIRCYTNSRDTNAQRAASWLAQVHERLDQAVLAAYGWPADIGTDELLARLLALNLERASGDAEMLPVYDFRGAERGKYAERVSTE